LLASVSATKRQASSVGTADEFRADQLYPQNLQDACKSRAFPLTRRMQEGYDHSYHFIATFIGEHLAYHAQAPFK
jgi:S-formylglutathione hydrolase